jgi:hypothetical protein
MDAEKCIHTYNFELNNVQCVYDCDTKAYYIWCGNNRRNELVAYSNKTRLKKKRAKLTQAWADLYKISKAEAAYWLCQGAPPWVLNSHVLF